MSVSFDSKQLKQLRAGLAGACETIKNDKRAIINRTADRHLARCKKDTPAGDSPDSPTLRLQWERSGVQTIGNDSFAEVFNPTEYASFVEYGHRQQPGRLVFIELTRGARKYGQQAKEIKSGRHQGKWGIFIRLKRPFVKGRFMMTDSEAKAKAELAAAALRLHKRLREAMR